LLDVCLDDVFLLVAAFTSKASFKNHLNIKKKEGFFLRRCKKISVGASPAYGSLAPSQNTTPPSGPHQQKTLDPGPSR